MAGYNPHNYMNPNAELRRYNGEYYMYTPTKTQDYDWGSVGMGGTVEKIANPLAAGYTQNDLNNTYNAVIDPTTWANNGKYTPDEIKSNVQKTFSGFDPNNTTGWQSQLDTLTKQATDLYNQDPTRQDKIFGDVWNTFRYNPVNDQGIQTIQAANNQPTTQQVMNSGDFAVAYKQKFGTDPTSQEITDWVVAGRPPLDTITPDKAPSGGVSYTIKAGDTLSQIARKFNTSIESIMAANPSIKNPNLIYSNQTIQVPGVNSGVDKQEFLNSIQNKITEDLKKFTDTKTIFKTDGENSFNKSTKDSESVTEFKMPTSSSDLYNKLVNTEEIKGMKNKLTEYQKELDTLDAEELAMEGDIRKQIEGEAPNSVIRAMVAEKVRALYPKKLAIQAEAKAVQTQLNQALENAKQEFTFKLQDQENGLKYLDTLIAGGVTLNAEQYKVADDALGYGSGFTKSYIQAKTKAANLKNEEDQLDLMDKILDLQTKLPEGQTFEFNGATYKSMSDPNKDIQIFNETDKATGKTVIIEYNKKTRQVTVTPTGVKTANPGGGSGNGSDEKEIQKFRNEAADLILKLDNGDVNWSSAFDNLRTKFPQATNETINSILGGGIPYDEKTGTFSTEKAWGRAKEK